MVSSLVPDQFPDELVVGVLKLLESVSTTELTPLPRLDDDDDELRVEISLWLDDEPIESQL